MHLQPVWQRNDYDQIVRDGEDMIGFREYIAKNSLGCAERNHKDLKGDRSGETLLGMKIKFLFWWF